jgi:hypothetical protein
MAWEVEFTDEFEEWWDSLSPEEQESVNAGVRLLQETGPALGRPHVDTLSKMSKHSQMKELRIQHAGDAYRVLFAFDPKRNAILLLGDRKADQKWYKHAVPKADKIFDEHLVAIERGEKERKKEK